MEFAVKYCIIGLVMWSSFTLGQDIQPELPEYLDVTTTTTRLPIIDTTSPELPTTEVPFIATTTTELPVIVSTTTELVTTESPFSTTSSSTTTDLPLATTRTPQPFRPPLDPTTSQNPFGNWDSQNPFGNWNSQNPFGNWDLDQQRCYLKDHTERSYYRLKCGINYWMPTINCYRCCYFVHSSFAGCSKLYNGRCGYYY